ncbi:MAG: ABC transporter ATP-binding protein [Methanotrichaceae archaeon]|jgi:NitT/TauT family transport system ATP-binding protein
MEGSVTMMLQLKEVSKEFGSGKNRVRSLQDINFEVNDGEIMAILGPSGCGKTTLLRIIAGLEQSSNGDVLLDGEKVERPSPQFGMVFQEHALLPWLSVHRNVSIGLEMRGIRQEGTRGKAMQYLSMVGLQDSAERYPHELSGGMRQRVAVARALTLEPKLLLMDEPFSALDFQTRRQIQQDILQVHERTGKAIIMVTHSIEEAVYLADRLVLLSSRPGMVREVLKIDLDRPRDRTSPLFLKSLDYVLNSLNVPVATESRKSSGA